MDNATIKKGRFSLKNKIVSKISTPLECVESTKHSRPISDVVNVVEEPPITTKKSNYMPQLRNVYNQINWQPLPDIAELLNDNEDNYEENDILKQTSDKNMWVSLPMPCLKCIAHQFAKVKLVLHEDKNQIQNIEARTDHQSRKRKHSPDLCNKKARIENGSSDQIQSNSTLEQCPVCALKFSSNSQEEKDAHIAQCLSGTDIDIMWWE